MGYKKGYKFTGEALRRKQAAMAYVTKTYKKKNADARVRHGDARKSGWSLTYKRWMSMRQRAGNAAYGDAYVNVKVDERWQVYENFLADMGECPPGMTLDRFPDQTGNYEPGNCRWATYAQQNRNCARNVLMPLPDGKMVPLVDWAEKYGIPVNRVRWRRGHGWTIEQIILGKSGRKTGSKPKRNADEVT
jgi:hypothetical protein